MDEFDLTVGLGLMGPVTEARYREVVEMGFNRVLFVLPRKSRDEDLGEYFFLGREKDLETLESFAELKQKFS